jgi:hypothetical protein
MLAGYNLAVMKGTELQALLDKYELRHADAAKALDVSIRSVERHVAAPRVPKVIELALEAVIARRAKESTP